MKYLRIPTAGTHYLFSDVMRGVLGFFESGKVVNDFNSILMNFLNVKNVLVVNSGTTAFYIMLELFKQIRKSDVQTEIVLPAYTAPSLLLPIHAAGLKAVLVDTDPVTFNLDINKLPNVISSATLAIMPIYMFGLPCDVDKILSITKDSNCFVVEDAASSLGTTINGRHTGAIAPFGFYSLNRGKNISTLAGGIIVWKDNQHSNILCDLCGKLMKLPAGVQAVMTLKLISLSLAVRPLFYTLLSPFVERFKDTTLHTHFDSFQYTSMQAALGKQLWKRGDILTQRRIENGKRLMAIFQNRPEYKIPSVLQRAEVAFNQFPVIVPDLDRRDRLVRELLKTGIETTLLYEKPLHEFFPELNPGGGDHFPNATYLAIHLLLIPTHAQINLSVIRKIQYAVESVY